MDTASLDASSLYSLLGSSNAPLVVDVRNEAAYQEDPHVIAGAVRPEGDLVEFAKRHGAGRRVVTYCVKGAEVGVGAAARLRQDGLQASFLAGGMDAWRRAGHPTIRRRPDWRVPGGSRWITRARPKIDRIACPWLIRRFIDPLATFEYVPAHEVLAQARARGAVAYDVAGGDITHRGERCSFDALIEDFGLRDPALERLATIVRGADTDRLDLAPQCAGLLAASLGLSQRFEDDHEMLEHAMPLYDGLYAWCRAEAAGVHETHAWTAPA